MVLFVSAIIAIIGGFLKIFDDGCCVGSLTAVLGGVVAIGYLCYIILSDDTFLTEEGILSGSMGIVFFVISVLRFGEFVTVHDAVHYVRIPRTTLTISLPWETFYRHDINPEAALLHFDHEGIVLSGAKVRLMGDVKYTGKENPKLRFRRADIESKIREAVLLSLAGADGPEINREDLEGRIGTFLETLLKAYQVELKVGISLIE